MANLILYHIWYFLSRTVMGVVSGIAIIAVLGIPIIAFVWVFQSASWLWVIPLVGLLIVLVWYSFLLGREIWR